MIFQATLCSAGGLTDGYTIIKADDISTARKLAKEWGEKQIEQIGLCHYSGYVELMMDIDKIKVKL